MRVSPPGSIRLPGENQHCLASRSLDGGMHVDAVVYHIILAQLSDQVMRVVNRGSTRVQTGRCGEEVGSLAPFRDCHDCHLVAWDA